MSDGEGRAPGVLGELWVLSRGFGASGVPTELSRLGPPSGAPDSSSAWILRAHGTELRPGHWKRTDENWTGGPAPPGPPSAPPSITPFAEHRGWRHH